MTVNEIAEEAYVEHVRCEAGKGLPANISEARAAAEKAVTEALKDAPQAERTLHEQELRGEGLRAISQRAHERLTDRGKRLLMQKARGQLNFADVLDVLVPLGEGQITLAGDLNARTETLADQLAFENVVEVQEAYTQRRRGWHDPVMPVLVQHGVNVRQAVGRGLL